ncbi:hypothetical protein VB776_16265 [Arcicella sp. DC2W]|uniref:Uncharacterized protein n=1 Tax=Arcicella gelida TaxID=2984195 RepID=A0ABU5S7N3_9BACT|nr:hypothetical protein [Arcicella sp. DC2W]MEA5404488.1 hypothetical protein [Arcicella sp. DC2W]
MEGINIIEELNNVKPAEAPEEVEFIETEEHFETEEEEQLQEEEEPVQQMSSAEFQSLSTDIVKTVDSIFVNIIDSKVYFSKYCKDIKPNILVECERLFNLEEDYKRGKITTFQRPDSEIETEYSQYRAYRQKIDRAKLTRDEIKSISKPLSSVIKHKMTDISPSTALVFAVCMAYVPRGLEAFTEIKA